MRAVHTASKPWRVESRKRSEFLSSNTPVAYAACHPLLRVVLGAATILAAVLHLGETRQWIVANSCTVPRPWPVAAVPAALAMNENKPMLPIIDTHQHLWDLSKFRLPWIKKGEPLAAAHAMADYARRPTG